MTAPKLDPAVLKEIEKGKRPLPVGSGEGLYARMETDTEFATRIALMQAKATARECAEILSVDYDRGGDAILATYANRLHVLADKMKEGK